MGRKFSSLVGIRFGKLVVLSLSGKKGIHYKWNCQCDCGNIKAVFGTNLNRGLSKSCGCEQSVYQARRKERMIKALSNEDQEKLKEKLQQQKREQWARRRKRQQGEEEHTTRTTWRAMIQRCTSKNHWKYHRYGGRGIKVCERWMKFKNFLEDMGLRPKGMTLDRINNNGNYEPSNCRWATHKEQANNK